MGNASLRSTTVGMWAKIRREPWSFSLPWHEAATFSNLELTREESQFHSRLAVSSPAIGADGTLYFSAVSFPDLPPAFHAFYAFH
jgi:hypothetical protein